MRVGPSTAAALLLQRDAAGADNALTLEQALAMATTSGASLGRPGQLGRIAVGQLADLVLVDTTGPHHLADDHPVPALGLRARAADVTTVIIDGRILLDHGSLVEMEESTLAAHARHAAAASHN